MKGNIRMEREDDQRTKYCLLVICKNNCSLPRGGGANWVREFPLKASREKRKRYWYRIDSVGGISQTQALHLNTVRNNKCIFLH